MVDRDRYLASFVQGNPIAIHQKNPTRAEIAPGFYPCSFLPLLQPKPPPPLNLLLAHRSGGRNDSNPRVWNLHLKSGNYVHSHSKAKQAEQHSRPLRLSFHPSRFWNHCLPDLMRMKCHLRPGIPPLFTRHGIRSNRCRPFQRGGPI